MRYLHITSIAEATDQLKRVGVDLYGVAAMVPKMRNVNVMLEGIECKVANILKQEMLSVGGDVAVARGTIDCSIDRSDAIIMGTLKQIKRFAEKISVQPFGLKKISENLTEFLRNMEKEYFELKTPCRTITLGDRTHIMGIINVTPDSFSDGGRFKQLKDAVSHGIKLEEEGADLLDIGGESSRPGSEPVTLEEELARVIPLVKELKKHVTVPLSIDTTKAEVARRCIDEGTEIVNDISSLRLDPQMAEIVARYKVPVVLMHMRGTPGTMQQGDLTYRSLTGDIINFLRERIEVAQAAGIDGDNIIIDPGIGFGKTAEDNIRLLKYLKEFKTLGKPILVGTSRKAFIGHVVGGSPLSRLEGTAATVTVSIMNGAHIVRVHDVNFMKRVSRMADSIARG
jgi:dihydropteroate synthase